jgi:hypothetical protein
VKGVRSGTKIAPSDGELAVQNKPGPEEKESAMRDSTSNKAASWRERWERHIEAGSSHLPSDVFTDDDCNLLRQAHILPPGSPEELDYVASHPRED